MRKIIILLLALWAVSLGQSAPQHSFVNGAPLPQPGSEAANHYAKLKSANSLIIYDCGAGDAIHWCKDPAFSFDNILRIAATVAQPSLDLAAMKKTVVSTGVERTVWPDTIFPGGTIDSNQMAPLAIVNRMDLADWNETSAKWTGAELRFVYGYHKNFTFSVEFVLPDASWSNFQQQALAWENLSASPHLLADLKNQVFAAADYRHAKLVRMGANRSQNPEDATVSWNMGQWTVDKGGMCISPLFRQIEDLHSQQYYNLWSRSENWIPADATEETVTEITVPKEMQSPLAKFNGPESDGLTTVGPRNPTPRVRNILALQQCTLCHSSETGTMFQHIANQTNSTQATLSKFLSGNTGNLDPSLSELGNAILNVTVRYYDTPTHETTTTRSFHDLARRKLFLSYLLSAQGPGDRASIANIRNYQVDFVH